VRTHSHGSADGYGETQTSLAWGQAWPRGLLSLIGTYSGNSVLHGSERAITASQDFRPYGGADRRSTFSNPGNIASLNGQNLPGLSSPY